MNRVQPDSFLTLHYRLCGPDGLAVVDTFSERPATISLGRGELSAAIESRLVGLEEGTRARIELAAGEAFGQHNAELVQRVSRAMLERHGGADERYEVGDVVEFPTPDGEASYAGVVRESAEDSVLFDFNHPLAGRPVSFEVHVIGVL